MKAARFQVGCMAVLRPITLGFLCWALGCAADRDDPTPKASPVISEFMADNESGLTDGDGQFSDWIEIFNPGPQTVALDGWSLTDDEADLVKWKFPTGTSLAPQGFLVVFASGRKVGEVRDAQGNLHTNFKLGKDGEYLALVKPDGKTITSQFAPIYPAQLPDVSFGASQDCETAELVGDEAGVSVLVPTDDSLGRKWTHPSFEPDDRWTRGQNGVGHENTAPWPYLGYQEALELYLSLDAASYDAPTFKDVSAPPHLDGKAFGNLNLTEGKIDSAIHLAGSDFDYLDLGNALDPDEKSYTVSLWFKVDRATDDQQTLIGKGGRRADDPGFRIYLQGRRATVQGLQAAASHAAKLGGPACFGQSSEDGSVVVGQWHHLAMVIDRQTQTVRGYLDGSNAGWSARVGDPDIDTDRLLEPTAISSTAHLVVGRRADPGAPFGGQIDDLAIWRRALDPAEIAEIHRLGSNGLSPMPPPPPSYQGLIKTDHKGPVIAGSTSSYIRLPFVLEDDPGSYDTLKLSIRYDDGFVAYLNGQEVARENAPESAGFDARAVESRPVKKAAKVEEIDLSAALPWLRTGPNVLSIHGLLYSPTEDGFFIAARLQAQRTTLGDARRYFPAPTPGRQNATGYQGFVTAPKLSRPHGFYTEPTVVAMASATEEARIHYTTDGSEPTEQSPRYEKPIGLERTTCLRAKAFRPGWRPSATTTQTFLFLAQVLSQPKAPAGFPPRWSDSQNPIMHGADYEMDPRIVDAPRTAVELLAGLKSLPTISLVMNMEDLFGRDAGIYTHPEKAGEGWEKAVSVEWIHPGGAPAEASFQVDGGVEVAGDGDRRSQFKKRSLRLVFKKAYGPAKLAFPLFEASQVSEVDSLVLRAGFDPAWHGAHEDRAQYLGDQWMRDTQRAMGQPAARGRFVHLYLNGLYWGLYNLVEDVGPSFAAATLGGTKSGWDGVSAGVAGGERGRAAWAALQRLSQAALAGEAVFDPLARQLDLDNLIDYALLNFYAGNQDWGDPRWTALFDTAGGKGFTFVSSNADRVLGSPTADDLTGLALPDHPTLLFHALRQFPAFRALLVERAREHLLAGGVLTPRSAAARYRALAAGIELAILAESARWGDAHRPTPYTRDGEWTAERDRLLTDYFPRRTQSLLGFLRNAGLVVEE